MLWRDEPAVGFAEAIAPTRLGQAFDFSLINYDRPQQDRRRDAHSTSTAEANDLASARLRKSQLRKDLGVLTVPPNCGIEIGDVIAFTDALINGSERKARVAGIATRFRRQEPGRAAVYEQRIALGGL